MKPPVQATARVASWIFSGLSFVCLVGCAPARYYDSLQRNGLSLGEAGRNAFAAELPRLLQKRGVRKVTVLTKTARHLVLEQRGAAPDLRELPAGAVEALYWALTYSKRGAELDQLIPVPGDLLAPVTTTYEPDGSMLATVGVPLPFDPDEAYRDIPSAEIKDRYGITVAVQGSAEWDHLELLALGQALGLLKPRELTIVAKVPVVREHWPVAKPISKRAKWLGETQARVLRRHHEGRMEQRIEVYDSLLAADISCFCGAADKPFLATTYNILHEFGHLIAYEPALAPMLQWSTQVNELKRNLPAVEAAQSPEVVADFSKKIQRVQELGKQVTRLRDMGPVLSAYKLARSQPHGPTPYGATSLAESFAEAFALFHCDPAALRRVDPAAADWFAQEGHLKSITEAAF